jgi:hypothetical protein
VFAAAQSTEKGTLATAPVVIVVGLPQEVLPFKVKLSNLKVPEPEAPDSEITTVIVPVRPVIPTTGVDPIIEPVVGTVPDPTLVPLIVMDQFCAPVLLLCRQKLKAVMSNAHPGFTSKVNVMLGVPLELLKEMACPDAPAKLVHAPTLFDQEELDKFASKVPGATVYGCVVMVVVPKSCKYICAFTRFCNKRMKSSAASVFISKSR